MHRKAAAYTVLWLATIILTNSQLAQCVWLGAGSGHWLRLKYLRSSWNRVHYFNHMKSLHSQRQLQYYSFKWWYYTCNWQILAKLEWDIPIIRLSLNCIMFCMRYQGTLVFHNHMYTNNYRGICFNEYDCVIFSFMYKHVLVPHLHCLQVRGCCATVCKHWANYCQILKAGASSCAFQRVSCQATSAFVCKGTYGWRGIICIESLRVWNALVLKSHTWLRLNAVHTNI